MVFQLERFDIYAFKNPAIKYPLTFRFVKNLLNYLSPISDTAGHSLPLIDF